MTRSLVYYAVALVATGLIALAMGEVLDEAFFNPAQVAVCGVAGTGVAALLTRYDDVDSLSSIAPTAILAGIALGAIYLAVILLGPYDSAEIAAREPSRAERQRGIAIVALGYLGTLLVLDVPRAARWLRSRGRAGDGFRRDGRE